MYFFTKIWVRLALQFYCSSISIKRTPLPANTPTILASNHPNSFLDAIIIGAYHPYETYFLARGDAFKKRWTRVILKALKMIPIYRLSEGKELLSENEQSFEECIRLLKENKTLLIFAEGICVNKMELQPLRKGTARIAERAWYKLNINNLRIQPLAIAYNSFTLLPKKVLIDFGTPFIKQNITNESEAIFYVNFNKLLSSRIQECIDEINKPNSKPRVYISKKILAVPAFAGFITHYWLYKLMQTFIKKKTKGTVFYDSALFAALMITYPLFVVITTVVVLLLTHNPLFAILLFLLPSLAWCYKKWKDNEQEITVAKGFADEVIATQR